MDRIFIRDREIATKDYVDSVAGGGAGVDLSNYYTKEEVDATSTETFYTKLYSAPSMEFMQTVVDVLKKGRKVIIKDSSSSSGDYRERSLYGPEPSSIDWETYEGTVKFISDWWLEGFSNPHRNYQVTMEPKWRTLVIRVTAGGVVTRVDSFNYNTHNNIINVVHELPVLGLKNQAEYIPTADYHPATKKYVDDSIAAAGTGGSGSGDLTNYYTKEEVDALIAGLRAEFLEVNTQLENIVNGGE